MKKVLKKVLTIIIIITFILINCIFLLNKSFYKNYYKTYYGKLYIPRYSLFIKERGASIATFYSLKSKEKLEKEIRKNANYENTSYLKYSVTDIGRYRIICIEYD